MDHSAIWMKFEGSMTAKSNAHIAVSFNDKKSNGMHD